MYYIVKLVVLYIQCSKFFSHNDLKAKFKQQAEKHAKNNSDVQYPAKIRRKSVYSYIKKNSQFMLML